MKITFGQSIYRNRTIDLRLKVKWEGIKYKLGLDFFFFFGAFFKSIDARRYICILNNN